MSTEKGSESVWPAGAGNTDSDHFSETDSDPFSAISIALIAALGCVAIYWAGLGGPFFFDSVERIVRNPALAASSLDVPTIIRAAYAGEQAYPERALANVSFAINHWLSGGRFVPAAFKLANIIIHVSNGLIVLWLLGRVLKRVCTPRDAAWIAALASALWLLHPIQLTSVLYAVQRMTSLSATCVLLGLVLFVIGRERLSARPLHGLIVMCAGVALGAGIGFFAKQNALLMPLFALLIEIFFFDRAQLAPGVRRALTGFFALTVALPVLIGLGALTLRPELVLDGYRARDFDVVERLLTQSRVLTHYLGQLLAPLPARFSLYHDDLALSTGLLSPPTTIACLALLGVLSVLLVVGWQRRWPVAFAVGWFLVGHALESSVWPLEMAHEHRNYLPALGIMLIVAWMLRRLTANWPRALGMGAAIAMPALLAVSTANRALDWRSPEQLMERIVRHHPDSPRAINALVANTPDMPQAERIALITRAALLDDTSIGPLLAIGDALGRGDDARAADAAATVTGLAPGSDRNTLLTGIASRVHERLERFALSTDSAAALVALTDCVIARTPSCAPWRDRLEQWIATAIARQRSTDINLSALHLSMAKLRATARDVDGALEHAAQVSRWTPSNLSYRLLEVELAARLGRRDHALAAFERMNHELGFRTRHDPRVTRLRQMLLPQ